MVPGPVASPGHLVRDDSSHFSSGSRCRLEVTGVPDPTPFSITVRIHIRTGWNFLSSPGQLQLGMDLQPKLSLRRQLMGLSPKYNDLGLGRDMAWNACPWGLLVFFFFFVFNNLCATPTPAVMVRHDIGLGRDRAWHACLWGLLVNSFNWGGVVKDLYCYLFLVFFFFFLITYRVSQKHVTFLSSCNIWLNRDKLLIISVN